jgi:hypothetical protein
MHALPCEYASWPATSFCLQSEPLHIIAQHQLLDQIKIMVDAVSSYPGPNLTKPADKTNHLKVHCTKSLLHATMLCIMHR